MRPARATLDLGAVRRNLATARGLAGGAAIAAVVKANAYGHGATRVVPALDRADKLAVASLEEALELRDAGAAQPVLLLEGAFAGAELGPAARHGFELVVHEPGQLRMLGLARLERPVDVWLKLDTGMNRLGFAPEEAGGLVSRLADLRSVGAVGLMTHFACADDPDASLTGHQLARYRRATAGLPGRHSLANSAALVAAPEGRGDLVRPGLMLWGASPSRQHSARDLGLAPALTLTTSLIAVRRVRAGETVGYGATWRARADATIGIAAIGYGDGYPQFAPPGTPVLVRGRACGLAGRVSMDMLAIDLGDLPRPAPGDPVTLWGDGLPVEAVAAAIGTSAYELFCRLTRRVPVVVADDAPAAE